MPTFMTSKFPIPKSSDEFEDICLDVVRLHWRDPHTQRNGRSGQGQAGVDIYGLPYWLKEDGNGLMAGAQCKNMAKLNRPLIRREIEKARDFKPPLGEYWFLTTASTDAKIQEFIRTSPWPFKVGVMWWDDISSVLAEHENLVKKYYPEWHFKEPGFEDLMQMILESEPEDWERLAARNELFLKRRPSLKICWEDEEKARKYNLNWAKQFPDPDDADLWKYFIQDGSNILRNMQFVNVDGGRCFLPAPKGRDPMWISSFEYHVGLIINYAWYGGSGGAYEYEQDLSRARFDIRDDE